MLDNVLPCLGRCVLDLDRKTRRGDLDPWCAGQCIGQPLLVERRRHDHDPQIVSQFRLDSSEHSQKQVSIDRPFVELIENDDFCFLERRILLQFADQNAFGDDHKLCLLGDFLIEANGVSDLLTNILVRFAGDPLGDGPGGNAARLNQIDPLVLRAQTKKRWRDSGRFPRPGGGFDGRNAMGAYGLCDRLKMIVDRERLHALALPTFGVSTIAIVVVDRRLVHTQPMA